MCTSNSNNDNDYTMMYINLLMFMAVIIGLLIVTLVLLVFWADQSCAGLPKYVDYLKHVTNIGQ